jgi:hypothetical protein
MTMRSPLRRIVPSIGLKTTLDSNSRTVGLPPLSISFDLSSGVLKILSRILAHARSEWFAAFDEIVKSDC